MENIKLKLILEQDNYNIACKRNEKIKDIFKKLIERSKYIFFL